MVRKARTLKAIDLFSGCGGLTLGMKKAGFKVVGAVEIDKRAVETFRRNHPEVEVLQKDILTIEGKYLLKYLGLRKGKLDLLAGCPPCQGFSRMRRHNRRRSSKDDRNDLVLKFTKLIVELAPKAVMLENVPGLENDRRFRRLLGVLRRRRYKFSWGILNVSNFGVPQRRRRLVVLACRKSRPLIDGIKTSSTKTVRQAIGNLERPRMSKRPLHRLVGEYSADVKEIIRKIPKDGGSRSALPTEMSLECHQRLAGFRDVYGRMAWDDLSPTITGGCVNPSKGRFLHPRQNRAITVFEASLLQSFPKTYKLLSKFGRYPNAEMIGNALPPRFARRVSSYMAGVLKNVG